MIKDNAETIIQDNKVTYKRYFDVPVDLVFEAWSVPEHLAEWWGPDGFTLTTLSMDFSNDGIWDFIMHGPDGHDYKNKIRFTDIQKPRHIHYKHLGDGEGHEDVNFESRILFEEVGEGHEDVNFESRILFEEVGEGTNLIMEQIFSSKEELERVNQKYGAIEGAKQHIANLAKYLEKIHKI
ncbi:SRPBCC domain-containing protein [Leptospira barantonii]|uniref:ATPase n=1 Tax=Leptospira barantonii TaxID=2023184 RepID=A0ABX4NIL5_9LEPT|nr:SRPBCC domain-containing protein [Leptospira barantonii]PJZ55821.1 ATPase [Leptospira barantonii]